MKLVIHVGSHKAGSTSIQDYCFHNQEVLSRQGICYPLGFFTQFPRQHSELRLLLARGDTNGMQQFFDKAIADAGNRQTNIVFLSGEDLCVLGPELVHRFYQVAMATNCFKEIEVVLLLRNKRDFLMSQYKHNLLYGPPIDEIKFLSSQRFSPRLCVEAWSALDNVNVKVARFEAMRSDFVGSFFRFALGLDVNANIISNVSQDYLTLQVVNTFLKAYNSRDILTILTSVNKLYPERVVFPVEKLISANIDEKYPDDDWRIPDFALVSAVLDKVEHMPVDPDPKVVCKKMLHLFSELLKYFDSTPNTHRQN